MEQTPESRGPPKDFWRLSNSPASTTKVVTAPPSPPHSLQAEMESSDPPDGSNRTSNFFEDDSSVAESTISRSDVRHTRLRPISTEVNGLPVHRDFARPDSESLPASDLAVGDVSNQRIPGSSPTSNDHEVLQTFIRDQQRIQDMLRDDPSSKGPEDRMLEALENAEPGAVDGRNLSTRLYNLKDAEKLHPTGLFEHESLMKSPAALAAPPPTAAIVTSLILPEPSSDVEVEGEQKNHAQMIPAKSTRKVSVLPPPIDVSSVHSLPSDLVRTPYPFKHQKSARRNPQEPSPISPTFVQTDKDHILTLSLRRNRKAQRTKVATITIPASLTIRTDSLPTSISSKAEESPTEKARRGSLYPGPFPKIIRRISTTANKAQTLAPTTLYDDTTLFHAIREKYCLLAGPWRFFSARVLKRIEITTSGAVHHRHPLAPCNQNAATLMQNGSKFATSYYPRSPRYLAARDLSDTFSEDDLYAHFLKPSLSKGRSAWVHWVLRIARAGAEDDERERTHAERLQRLERQRERASRKARVDVEGSDTERSTTPTLREILEEERVSDSKSWQRTSRRFSKYPGALLVPDDEKDAEIGQEDGVVGLEFVEEWSVGRILAALILVLLLSVMTTLLWTYYGTNWFGRGESVLTGLVMGLFVLTGGLSLVGAWCWASWLIV